MNALLNNLLIVAAQGGIFDALSSKMEELVGKLQALSFWVAVLMTIIALLGGMIEFQKADEVKRVCIRIALSFFLICIVTAVYQAIQGWAVFTVF